MGLKIIGCEYLNTEGFFVKDITLGIVHLESRMATMPAGQKYKESEWR